MKIFIPVRAAHTANHRQERRGRMNTTANGTATWLSRLIVSTFDYEDDAGTPAS